MEALQLTTWKHPPELRDVPEPDPGPGQVVVRIGGAGACHSDLHLMHDFEPGLFAELRSLVPEEVTDVAAILPGDLRPLWSPA